MADEVRHLTEGVNVQNLVKKPPSVACRRQLPPEGAKGSHEQSMQSEVMTPFSIRQMKDGVLF